VPLNTKTVLTALLNNLSPAMPLTEICRKAKLKYSKIYKRIQNDTLHKLYSPEFKQLSRAIGVSHNDLNGLLLKVVDGQFPDDYPLSGIVLERDDLAYLNDRVVAMLLTEEEALVINTIRAGAKKKLDEVIDLYQKGEESKENVK